MIFGKKRDPRLVTVRRGRPSSRPIRIRTPGDFAQGGPKIGDREFVARRGPPGRPRDRYGRRAQVGTASNYVRDKSMGMGQRIPNIVSPITGEEEAAPSLGYAFPETEENERRWRGWWKVANQEQFLIFFCLGLLTLVALSVLVNSTIGKPSQQPWALSASW